MKMKGFGWRLLELTERVSNIKLTGRHLLYSALGIGGVCLLGFGIYATGKTMAQKQSQDRIKYQQQFVRKNTEDNADRELKTWATEKTKVSDDIFQKVNTNPSFTNVKRFATLIVNVVDNKSRANAYSAVPFKNKEVAGWLAEPDSNYGFYNEPKSVKLVSGGRTYGSSFETYNFLFETVWHDKEGNSVKAYESVSMTFESGKVTKWEWLKGRR